MKRLLIVVFCISSQVVCSDQWELVVLQQAIYNNQFELVQQMVSDNPALVHAVDSEGYTVLYYATHYISGHPESNKNFVVFFLSKKANPNRVDKNGNTPLHSAVYRGLLSILPLLLNAGTHIDAQDKEGNTVLHLTAQYKKVNIARSLLKHGANTTLPNSLGHSPLHTAAEHNRLKILRLLIGKGVPVDQTDHGGNTSLLIAAHNNHTTVMEELLRQGARINHKNAAGKTALCMAANAFHILSCRLLVKKGALLDEESFGFIERRNLLPLACAHNYHNLRIAQNTLRDDEYKKIKAEVDSLQKKRLRSLREYYQVPNNPQLVRNQKRGALFLPYCGVPFSPYSRPTNDQLDIHRSDLERFPLDHTFKYS